MLCSNKSSIYDSVARRTGRERNQSKNGNLRNIIWNSSNPASDSTGGISNSYRHISGAYLNWRKLRGNLTMKVSMHCLLTSSKEVFVKIISDLSVQSAPKTAEESLRTRILQSCHATLIRLGDLSRYRETELVAKDRNWGPAIGYYDLAMVIYPASGASHNQLAVIALADGNHLRATYHLYRALSAHEPHPSAR